MDTAFLPKYVPEFRLPKDCDSWLDIAKNLSIYNERNSIVPIVESMQYVDYTVLRTCQEQRFAYVVLSMIANSYLRLKKTGKTNVLPRNLAVPLWNIAKTIGISPVVTHAGLDLWNYKLIDDTKPFEVENLSQLVSFTGSDDEKYFCCIMTEIEHIGTIVYDKLISIKDLIKKDDVDGIINILKMFSENILNITKALDKMFTGCRPDYFFNVIRPYLAGWQNEGLIFEGVSDEVTHYKGGSAAQSSLIQLFDIVLGVYHESPFFAEMRNYMPKTHREILEKLAEEMDEFKLSDYVYESPNDSLRDIYKKCVDLLAKFRAKHMEIAHKYITKMIPKNVNAVGTGGEDIKEFLKTAKNETLQLIKN